MSIFNRSQKSDQLNLMRVKMPRPANWRGDMGEKCEPCAGFGFTVRFPDGKILFCKQCKKTGVSNVQTVLG